jgi:hypothetical protein
LGVQDPGPRFYLDIILYRATFLTLPFSAIGLIQLWPRKRRARAWKRREGLAVLLLLGFAVFYLLQMSLGGWKDGRYMLPVLLVLDVLAALGIVWCVDRMSIAASGRIAVIAGLIVAQGCVVLLHHPYYGTHYNELLGGSAAASHVFPLAEFGEGLDLAGQYVDSRPDAVNAVFATQFLANEMVAQHVRAPVYDVGRVGDDADYLVFGVQYTMRGSNYPRWGALWEETYKFREPAFVAAFDDLPYAWVHQPDAAPVVPQRVEVQLGEAIQLVGYRLPKREVAPGDRLLLTLYWQAEAPIGDAYTVFTHLLGPGGALTAQQDNPPGRGTRPTDGWVPGTLVEDSYEIEVPPDAPPGEYTVSTGMYSPTTLERLPAFGADGERLSDDQLALTTVHVRPTIPYWRRILSVGWCLIIIACVVYTSVKPRRREDL